MGKLLFKKLKVDKKKYIELYDMYSKTTTYDSI